jgi:hypothetical protein
MKRQDGRMNSAATVLAVGVALMLLGTAGASAGAAVRHSHGDIVEFGSDIVIPADQEVRGDVVDFGGNVDVHGKVDGSAVVFGGDLHIYPEGSVERDTVSFGGSIINDSSATPPKKHPHNIVVPPAVPPVETPEPSVPSSPEIPMAPEPSRDWSFRAVWASLLVPDFILTFLAFFLFPLRARNVEEHLVAQPLLAVLIGFIAPIFLCFVLVVLAVLVVTIPLLPVAAIAFVLAYLIGKAAIAAFLGRRLLEAAKVAEPQPLASVLVGLFVILIVTGLTPAWFAISMYGIVGALAVGAALLSFMRTRPGLLGAQGTAYSDVSPAHVGAFTPPAGPPASGPPAIPQ